MKGNNLLRRFGGFVLAALLLFSVAIMSSTAVQAQRGHGGGFHGGGFHGGGFRGGGFHDRGFHGGGFRTHIFIGPGFGYGYPYGYYGYPYAYPYGYPYGYYRHRWRY